MELTGLGNKVQQKFLEEMQSKASQEPLEQGSGNSFQQSATDSGLTNNPSETQSIANKMPGQSPHASQVENFQSALNTQAPSASSVAPNIYLQPLPAAAPVEPGSMPFNDVTYFHNASPIQSSSIPSPDSMATTDNIHMDSVPSDPTLDQRTMGDKILDKMISLDGNGASLQATTQGLSQQSGTMSYMLQMQVDLIRVTSTAKISSTAGSRTAQGVQALEKSQ